MDKVCIRCKGIERGNFLPDSEIICSKCAMWLTDHLEGNPWLYAIRGELARALKEGKLQTFIAKHRIGARVLEKHTGISYGQWRVWAKEREKVPDTQISQILAALDAGQRRDSDKTYR